MNPTFPSEPTFTVLPACGPPPLGEQMLSTVFVLGPLVVIPLLVWLRWSPRNGRDVLGSAPVAPASRFQRLLGVSGWMLLAPLLLLLPASATALIHASMLFRLEGSLHSPREWVLDPSWGQIAGVVLASSWGLLYWLRTSNSEQDVLHVQARM